MVVAISTGKGRHWKEMLVLAIGLVPLQLQVPRHYINTMLCDEATNMSSWYMCGVWGYAALVEVHISGVAYDIRLCTSVEIIGGTY